MKKLLCKTIDEAKDHRFRAGRRPALARDFGVWSSTARTTRSPADPPPLGSDRSRSRLTPRARARLQTMRRRRAPVSDAGAEPGPGAQPKLNIRNAPAGHSPASHQAAKPVGTTLNFRLSCWMFVRVNAHNCGVSGAATAAWPPDVRRAVPRRKYRKEILGLRLRLGHLM